MKKRLYILFLLTAASAQASTVLRLHQPASGVTGYQAMTLALGPHGAAVATAITYTTASGTSIQFTQTGGGTAIKWMSEPFASGATLSGTETLSAYAKEAASGNNATFQFQLRQYSGGSEGSTFCTGTYSNALTTSMAANAPTCTATSTTFATGDSLVVYLFVTNHGTMGAGSPGVTMDYDGPTASADGDTKLTLAETVSFDPWGGAGGTPSPVQSKNDSDYVPDYLGGGSGVSSGQYISAQFESPTGANNLLVALLSSDSTGTSIPTLTDDATNTWYLGATCNDAGNGEQIFLYYAPNAAASTKQVKATYHASTQYSGSLAVFEVTNTATASPIDGSTCALGSTTTVAAGGVTPNYSGDLVVQYAWNETISTINQGGAIGVHYTHGSQSNIAWKKLLDGYAWAYGAQWGVYTSTSALNPTFAVSTAGFNTLAVFFRSANAGTAQPAGIYVTDAMNVPVVSTIGSGSVPNPLTVYFPCQATANLLIANYAGPSNSKDLTGVADSHSNSWTANHALYCDGTNNTCVHTYGAPAATASDDQYVTLTSNGTWPTDNIQLMCVKGAAASPFDFAVVNSGNQSVAGDLTLFSGTVTPSTSNGLVVVTGSQYSNTTASFSTSQNYTGCYWSGEIISIGGCSANNPWGTFYNSNTSSETWTAHMVNGSTAVAQWAAEADVYKVASGASAIRKGRVWVIQ